MIYVFTLLLLGYQNTSVSTTSEYNDYDSCKAMEKEVRRQLTASSEKPHLVIITTCMPKGAKK